MFNDSIRAGVQFANIHHQHHHVLLQLWRQEEDNQQLPNHPKKPGVGTTDRLPTATWNLEEFLVPSRRKKPPQVTWATMPEPPEEKELAIALPCVTGDASPPVTRNQMGPEASCGADNCLVPKQHTKGYGAG